MESFMDYYLVEEAMGQPEINWKSVYMSKEVGGKLKMGPVWDFDWSAMGPSTGKYKNQYREQYGDFRSVDNWFAALYQGSLEFREALALRWETVRPRILSAIDEVEAEKPMLERAARRDILKWHWYRFRGGFDAYSDEVLEWCRNRVEWMDGEIGKN
ncbi:MAG: CotH kinase family protein, partial [Clostridia bacterium]|nr:CotH kinase family protein [Clostridia bacterium]